MIKEYCDRCGAEMQSSRYKCWYGTAFSILIFDFTPWRKEHVLCQSCRNSFYEWLKGEQK